MEQLPDFGVRIYGDGEFPLRLNDARYPLRIFYYQGDWQLIYLPGTLVQAKAALQQGRKLFILDNNFLNPSLSWPKKYEKEGAIRIKNYNELKKYLTTPSPKD